MNRVHVRPLGGWTLETVPTEPFQHYTIWSASEGEHEVNGAYWSGFIPIDVLVDAFFTNEVVAWQYLERHAPDDYVQAAIAMQRSMELMTACIQLKVPLPGLSQGETYVDMVIAAIRAKYPMKLWAEETQHGPDEYLAMVIRDGDLVAETRATKVGAAIALAQRLKAQT